MLVPLPLPPSHRVRQLWLRSPVQDLRPQGGPVRKQTNSETPLSSWYVSACLLKVCQLLNSWVIAGSVSCFLVF